MLFNPLSRDLLKLPFLTLELTVKVVSVRLFHDYRYFKGTEYSKRF